MCEALALLSTHRMKKDWSNVRMSTSGMIDDMKQPRVQGGKEKTQPGKPSGRGCHGPSAAARENAAKGANQLRPKDAEGGSPPSPEVEEPGKRRLAT